MTATKTRPSSALQSTASDDPRLASEPRTAAERAVERTLFGCRWLLAPFYLGLGVSLSVLLIKSVQKTVALAAGNPAPAQRADSNIGLEGGHSGLVDSVLATPNRKTPVPQDNIFATAPGAQQAAPMPQSNKKAIETPRIINRIFPDSHQ